MAQLYSNSQNPQMMQDWDKQNQNQNQNQRTYVNDNFVYPTGYRFCPRDEELIVNYLKKRIRNELLPHDKIKEVNLYKHSPKELADNFPMVGEKAWYFFTSRDRKYPNGNRPNRAAGTGFWKATGADKPIKHNNVKVGFRKSLVFYEGKPPKGNKTNWIMHEFRVDESRRVKTHATDMKLDDWVLCMIYQRKEKSKGTQKEKHDQGTQKEKHDQGTQKDQETIATPIDKLLENSNYEGIMNSCVEFAGQPLELPYQYNNNFLYDPNLIMNSSLSSSFSLGNMCSDQGIFPMNADFNTDFNNLYQDLFHNIGGMIGSDNAFDIGVLDENLLINKN